MDFNVHARTRSYGYSNLKDPANKFDFDEFKRLAKEDGIENIHVSSEFFMKYKDMKIKDTSSELNEKIITDIITEIKNDIKEGKNVGKLYDLETHQETTHHEYGAADTYENTPLQQDAINKAIDAMKRGCTDLLLSAVMRFGKTHCCYEIIKEAPDIKYVLVTSAKADVRAAWKDDINHEDFLDNFVFIELPSDGSLTISKKNQKGVYEEVKKENPNKIKQYIDEGKTVIVFATLQDLAGKKGFDANVIKDKHKFLYNDEYPLDMIIIDETHYGSHSNVYGTAVGLAKNKYEANSTELKEAKKEAEDVDRISKAVDEIKHKYTLQCSGTPYYILASGEFSEIYKNKEIISNVGFSDMIDARDKWVDEHINDDNFDESKSPYFGIPNMIKFGMNLTKECRKVLSKNKDINTSLSFLFKNSNDKFENESAVTELMESIFGANNHKMPGFLDQKRIKEGEIFKHIIMVLPHIDDCHVLKKLLIDKNIIDDDPESDEYRKIIVATERRTAKDQIQKYEQNPNYNWWIYRTKAFSGHSIARSKQIGEFYALTSKQDTYENSCGLYKDFINRKDRTGKPYLMYYIVLNNENELQNFWNYIHTDFVNIILYFYKTGLNLFRGVLNEIPWQDFSNNWDDYKLFNKYNFTEDEIKHIYDILPNYYNIKRIDLNKYKNIKVEN